jgi:hypothetical protein
MLSPRTQRRSSNASSRRCKGDIRTPEERARDVNRLPPEILEFFRMREDMRVIEILPAGGWFTKILAPVLREKGKLYVAHPEGFYANAYREIADLPGLEEVEEIGWGATAQGAGGPFGPSGTLGRRARRHGRDVPQLPQLLCAGPSHGEPLHVRRAETGRPTTASSITPAGTTSRRIATTGAASIPCS